MSNYFLDVATGEIYFASVVLTNAKHLDAPPLVVSAVELIREERFLPLTKEVADTLK